MDYESYPVGPQPIYGVPSWAPWTDKGFLMYAPAVYEFRSLGSPVGGIRTWVKVRYSGWDVWTSWLGFPPKVELGKSTGSGKFDYWDLLLVLPSLLPLIGFIVFAIFNL